MVRHVDPIGKTDESLIAITMTGRIASAPSTSGLKVVLGALLDSTWLKRSLLKCLFFRNAAIKQVVCHGVAWG